MQLPLELWIIPLAVLLLGILIVLWLAPQPLVVPEAEIRLILRLGRFHRVATPGMTIVWRRLDTVQDSLHTRNEPSTFRIDGIFIYGIPVGLTLNLWSRFDPLQIAGNNKQRLKDLVLINDAERHAQAGVKVKQALVEEIGAVEGRRKLSQAASIIDKLLPIIPNVPECSELLKHVSEALRSDLRALGIAFDESHPLTITRIQISDDLIGVFERERVIPALRKQFPDLPDATLAQLFATSKGWELVPFEVLQVTGTGDLPARVERRNVENGKMTGITFSPPAPEPAPAEEASGQVAARKIPDQGTSTKLSKSDLAVLKRLPRDTQYRQVGS